jgi:hypothetical protein
MELIQKEILLAAVHMAVLDNLPADETVAVVFRAIDHEMMGEDGRSFNPARITGVGSAIYAAMFDYPFELLDVPDEGFVWQAKIPKHGFSTPFEMLLNKGKSIVEECRKEQKAQQDTLKHF